MAVPCNIRTTENYRGGKLTRVQCSCGQLDTVIPGDQVQGRKERHLGIPAQQPPPVKEPRSADRRARKSQTERKPRTPDRSVIDTIWQIWDRVAVITTCDSGRALAANRSNNLAAHRALAIALCRQLAISDAGLTRQIGYTNRDSLPRATVHLPRYLAMTPELRPLGETIARDLSLVLPPTWDNDPSLVPLPHSTSTALLPDDMAQRARLVYTVALSLGTESLLSALVPCLQQPHQTRALLALAAAIGDRHSRILRSARLKEQLATNLGVSDSTLQRACQGMPALLSYTKTAELIGKVVAELRRRGLEFHLPSDWDIPES